MGNSKQIFKTFGPLALTVILVASANVHAGPIEVVNATVGRLLQILQVSSEGTKARQMCSLVHAQVDNQTIGLDLLGRQFAKSDDVQGINQFMALVPSIIVSEFFETLSKVKSFEYDVINTLLPMGSTRVGVKTIVSGTPVVLTLSKSTLLIQDVSWNTLSLIKSRKRPIQAKLLEQSKRGVKSPVGEVAKSLVRSGELIRCN